MTAGPDGWTERGVSKVLVRQRLSRSKESPDGTVSPGRCPPGEGEQPALRHTSLVFLRK